MSNRMCLDLPSLQYSSHFNFFLKLTKIPLPQGGTPPRLIQTQEKTDTPLAQRAPPPPLAAAQRHDPIRQSAKPLGRGGEGVYLYSKGSILYWKWRILGADSSRRRGPPPPIVSNWKKNWNQIWAIKKASPIFSNQSVYKLGNSIHGYRFRIRYWVRFRVRCRVRLYRDRIGICDRDLSGPDPGCAEIPETNRVGDSDELSVILDG